MQCWECGQWAHLTWVGYWRCGSFLRGLPHCESHRTKADMYVNTYHTSVRLTQRHNRHSYHTPTPFECISCWCIRTLDHSHNLEIKPEYTCLLNTTIYINFQRVKSFAAISHSFCFDTSCVVYIVENTRQIFLCLIHYGL